MRLKEYCQKDLNFFSLQKSPKIKLPEIQFSGKMITFIGRKSDKKSCTYKLNVIAEEYYALNVKMFRKVIIALMFLFCLTGLGLAQTDKSKVQAEQKSEILKVTDKPQSKEDIEKLSNKAKYVVLLKVTFLANGEIGDIIDVSKKNHKKLLKEGFVDEAIKAAKKIKFEPAKSNGVPVTVIKIVAYTFTEY